MIKIASAVKEIIGNEEEALIALNEGYLNMSAYAARIQKRVEKVCKKSVKNGTIVAALNRLKGKIKTSVPSFDRLVIDDLAVKIGLTELTFERTSDVVAITASLSKEKNIFGDDILFICHGVREISFFVYEKNRKTIQEYFKKIKPKFVKNKLISLTVRLADEAIPFPNHAYTVLRSLVMKKISVIDNITTYSELTFILEENDLNLAIETINGLIRKA
ncbi:hypothetical protein IT411_03210 [Candidatus Peregrinibacteria bacterium]|nr:hypothetical protein [Candidatus Peregrinibacteria bacterium]